MSSEVLKHIYLDEVQVQRLKDLSAATRLSESDIIRLALEKGLEALAGERKELSAWPDELQFIDQWLALGADGRGRTWKRDELYDP